MDRGIAIRRLVVGALAGLMFAMAGATRAAELVVPPATPAPHFAPGAKVQGVAFTKAVSGLRDGQVWATVAAQPFCFSTLPLQWKAGSGALELGYLSEVFKQELVSAGAASDGAASNIFEDAGASSNLEVGALFKNLEGQFCSKARFEGSPERFAGAAASSSPPTAT